MNKETGLEVIHSGFANMASFGKLSIMNPDLAERFINNWPLNEYKNFFAAGGEGYTDFPFYRDIKNVWLLYVLFEIIIYFVNKFSS